jgi:hypothetical protein
MREAICSDRVLSFGIVAGCNWGICFWSGASKKKPGRWGERPGWGLLLEGGLG